MSPILNAVTIANDAAMTITALIPIIKQHLNGQKEVTQEDIDAALASKDAALRRMDETIKRMEDR
jgi:hypothetical protein